MMELARPRIRSAIDDAMSGSRVAGGGGADPVRVLAQLQTLADPKGPISQLPVKGLTNLSQKFGSALLARASGRLEKEAQKIRTESRTRSESMLDQVFETTPGSDNNNGSNGSGKRSESSLMLVRTVESSLNTTPSSKQTSDFEESNNNYNDDMVTELLTERVVERTLALGALLLETARKGIEPSTPSSVAEE